MPTIENRNLTENEISTLNRLSSYFSKNFSKTYDSRFIPNMFETNYLSHHSTTNDVINHFFLDQTGGFAYHVLVIDSTMHIVSSKEHNAQVEFLSQMSRAFWLIYILHRSIGNLCNNYINNLEEIFNLLNSFISNQNTPIVASAFKQVFNEKNSINYGANAFTLLINVLSNEYIRDNNTYAQRLITICQNISDILSKENSALTTCLNAKSIYGIGQKIKNGFFQLVTLLELISRSDNLEIVNSYTNLVTLIFHKVAPQDLIAGLLESNSESCGLKQLETLFSILRPSTKPTMSMLVFSLLIKICTDNSLEDMTNNNQKKFATIRKCFLSLSDKLMKPMKSALDDPFLYQAIANISAKSALLQEIIKKLNIPFPAQHIGIPRGYYKKEDKFETGIELFSSPVLTNTGTQSEPTDSTHPITQP